MLPIRNKGMGSGLNFVTIRNDQRETNHYEKRTRRDISYKSLLVLA
jgi:hypothetical protein